METLNTDRVGTIIRVLGGQAAALAREVSATPLEMASAMVIIGREMTRHDTRDVTLWQEVIGVEVVTLAKAARAQAMAPASSVQAPLPDFLRSEGSPPDPLDQFRRDPSRPQAPGPSDPKGDAS